MTGLVLFIVRNWSDKAVFIAAVLFLLQPVEWYHYVAGLINPSHQLPDLKVGEMYAEVAEYTKAGEFWPFIWENIYLRPEGQPPVGGQCRAFLSDGRDCLRHVAEAGVYYGAGRLFRTSLSEQEVQ